MSSHCCVSFFSFLFYVPDQFYHLIFPPCLSLVLFRGPGCINTKAHRHSYDESGWIFVMTGLTEPLVIAGCAGKGEGYKRVIIPLPWNFNHPPSVCVCLCVPL